MSVKRKPKFDINDSRVRLPGLQPHQIRLSMDPRVPTRMLVENALAAMQASEPEPALSMGDELPTGGLN